MARFVTNRCHTSNRENTGCKPDSIEYIPSSINYQPDETCSSAIQNTNLVFVHPRPFPSPVPCLVPVQETPLQSFKRMSPKRMSPAAWRHIHLNGHYTFLGNAKLIDLDAIMARLDLL
jgi:hypothetical protein